MAIISKLQQVDQFLRGRIARGEWVAGQRIPSDAEICERLGVSRATLSTAMTNLANEGILVRKQRSGTYVASNEVNKPKIVLLTHLSCLSSPAGFYYRSMVQHVRKAVSDAGYSCEIAVADGASYEETLASIRIADRPFADNTLGVISTVLGCEKLFASAGIRSVTIVPDEGGEADYGTHAVLLKYDRLIKSGIDLLREHGYEDFVVMYHGQWPGESSPTGQKRKDWILQACGSGVSKDQLVEVPFSWEVLHAYETFRDMWKRGRRPQAVFFLDDAVCDNATRAILELGIKVPEELAIITHANAGRRFFFPVRLTRLQFDPQEIITKAWEILDKTINNEKIESPIAGVSPQILPGHSLGSLAESATE